MSDINSYIILNKKTKFIINFFIYISILVFLSLIVVSNFKYKKYYQTIGQVIKNENAYQLSLYLCPYQLNIIKNNNKLTIDNLEYTYNINHIADEYIIFNDYNKYLKVILDIDLKEKDKIINNTLQVKILESNKKIFYYVKEYLKKGRLNE